jgi:hypothetical protein
LKICIDSDKSELEEKEEEEEESEQSESEVEEGNQKGYPQCLTVVLYIIIAVYIYYSHILLINTLTEKHV